MAETAKIDGVDVLVSSWQRVRPDFNTEPLTIFSRLWRLQPHIDKMRRKTFARHGIESWEFDMLCALRRNEGRLTAGKLMRETLVSSGTVTNRIDRMVSHGFARRLADSEDGRVVHVEITDEGLRVVDAAMEDLISVEAAVLADMSAESRAHLAALLRNLLIRFD